MRTQSDAWPRVGEAPRKASRRERNKAEVHAALLRAARELFAERGVAGTTVEDIAAYGGVSRATFFNYFGGKDGVLQALHEAHIEELSEVVDELLVQESSTSARLHALFDDVARIALTAPGYFASLTGELDRRLATPEISAQRTAQLDGQLVRLLEPGVAAGDVRDDPPVLFLAQIVGMTYVGVIRHWRECGKYDIEENCRAAAEFLAGALEPGQARG